MTIEKTFEKNHEKFINDCDNLSKTEIPTIESQASFEKIVR